jgi:hypothetical protein
MNLVCRMIAVLLVAVAGVFSVHGQDVTKEQTTQQTVTDNQTTTPDDYVFPTPKERFKRYVLSTVGPMPIVRASLSAGIQQWRDSPEEWGQGMKGYGRRFASNMGRNLIQQTVTYGLDSALELDTGFQRSKRQGFGARLKDALVQNVTSRTKSGNRVISAPRLAGVYTAGVVAAETWYPDRYDWKDGLRQGTTSLLTGFGINVLREFVIKF